MVFGGGRCNKQTDPTLGPSSLLLSTITTHTAPPSSSPSPVCAPSHPSPPSPSQNTLYTSVLSISLSASEKRDTNELGGGRGGGRALGELVGPDALLLQVHAHALEHLCRGFHCLVVVSVCGSKRRHKEKANEPTARTTRKTNQPPTPTQEDTNTPMQKSRPHARTPSQASWISGMCRSGSALTILVVSSRLLDRRAARILFCSSICFCWVVGGWSVGVDWGVDASPLDRSTHHPYIQHKPSRDSMVCNVCEQQQQQQRTVKLVQV